MCLACDMEALWFAVMEARACAAPGAAVPQGEKTVPQGEAVPQQDETVPQDEAAPERDEPLLPPPERGRVGEGVAGGMHETADSARGRSADPHPNPPPEEGGGGARSVGERSAPPRRFACEETSAE